MDNNAKLVNIQRENMIKPVKSNIEIINPIVSSASLGIKNGLKETPKTISKQVKSIKKVKSTLLGTQKNIIRTKKITGSIHKIAKSTQKGIESAAQAGSCGIKAAATCTTGPGGIILSATTESVKKSVGTVKNVTEVSGKIAIKSFAKTKQISMLLQNKNSAAAMYDITKTGVQAFAEVGAAVIKSTAKISIKILKNLGKANIVLISSLFVPMLCIFCSINNSKNDSQFGTKYGMAPGARETVMSVEGIEWYKIAAAWYKIPLPNCTTYAYGRFCEIIGSEAELSSHDAETFWKYNEINQVYDSGQDPRPGAICVWEQGTGITTPTGVTDKFGNKECDNPKGDAAGHVAIVEEVKEDGTIIISESGFKTSWNPYHVVTFSSEDELKNRWKSYNFLGFIYPNECGVTVSIPEGKKRYTDATGTYEYAGEYVVTGYCPCEKCCGKTDGITSSGVKATPNHTIAADLRYWNYGDQVVIDGILYTVEDIGGAIKGNHFDMYFDTHNEALNWGKKKLKVYKKVK